MQPGQQESCITVALSLNILQNLENDLMAVSVYNYHCFCTKSWKKFKSIESYHSAPTARRSSRQSRTWRSTSGSTRARSRSRARLSDGDSQILRLYVFGHSGFWTMAPLCYAVKFDPFHSLDCAKERKESNFAIWQHCSRASFARRPSRRRAASTSTRGVCTR